MHTEAKYSKEEKEAVEKLTQRYPVTIGEKNGRSWETPFGVSFADPNFLGETLGSSVGNWHYFYDAKGSSMMGIEGSAQAPLGVNEFKGGFLNPYDVLDILVHLENKEKGYKVYDKSPAIAKLEVVLGVEARMHYRIFGAWHILLLGFMSCISNPFAMDRFLFATGGIKESTFEVHLFKNRKGKSSTMEMHVDELLAMLERKNLTPLTTVCRGCGIVSPRKSLRVCARCKKAFFCDEVCQRFDWKEHNHKAICISGGK